jgi:hypothetical protein
MGLYPIQASEQGCTDVVRNAPVRPGIPDPAPSAAFVGKGTGARDAVSFMTTPKGGSKDYRAGPGFGYGSGGGQRQGLPGDWLKNGKKGPSRYQIHCKASKINPGSSRLPDFSTEPVHKAVDNYLDNLPATPSNRDLAQLLNY